ncbi:MAG: radical SAM protein [Candidatus Bathyarchaeota archaeon]|nr:radical SAM protein [Candidatus Bathyarchaeota archaeon]
MQGLELPELMRVSVGSAMVLGLLEGKLDAKPTTAYLMTYRDGKCVANCGFCPQAKSSQCNTELLSRVTWPAFPAKTVLQKICTRVQTKKTIKRVCIQALNYPAVFEDITAFVKALKQQTAVEVSVSCQPKTKENMQKLADAGVDRIGIGIDAATKEIFDQVKGAHVGGPYSWADQFRQLGLALEVFGKGNVSTHIIVGLGETEKEAVEFVGELVGLGVLPALFAFTPVRGTALGNQPQPKLESYRRVQLARYLIVNGLAQTGQMRFNVQGEIEDFGVDKTTLLEIIETGKPFHTSGCPNCNRPFYNEKPSGPFYNYPRRLSSQETAAIKAQLSL